ncbi:MAG: shikimate kinase [Actinomycetota bacterium]
MPSIVLVGLMGAGKTTVARLLAERTGTVALDTDDAIEERTGRAIPELFATDGEAVFRRLEADVVSGLLADDVERILSLGGGAVTSEPVRAALDGHHVVWLRAGPATLIERLGPDEVARRPLLADDAMATLTRLEEEREPYHRRVADLTVDVDELDPPAVAEAILAALAGGRR